MARSGWRRAEVPLYVVTYDHPDDTGWQAHVLPHIAWLQGRLRDGALVASGPFDGNEPRSAMLVMSAPDRSALEAIVATDPFAVHGLIENMTVRAWDPIFGAFNAASSRPGQLQG